MFVLIGRPLKVRKILLEIVCTVNSRFLDHIHMRKILLEIVCTVNSRFLDHIHIYVLYNEGIILFIDNYYKPKLHMIN